MLKQYLLQTPTIGCCSDFAAQTLCWLEEMPTLKRGTRVTLKEDGRIWTILHVYDTRLDRSDIKRGWHNNI
jgi:hypothetical protein